MSGEQYRDYAKALDKCETLGDLQTLVREFAELAVDAMVVVNAMTEDDWPEFRVGLTMERLGEFAGDEWAARFGAILMPLPMMTITQVAAKFNAPFGVAWHRCKDLRPDLLKVAPPESGTP